MRRRWYVLGLSGVLVIGALIAGHAFSNRAEPPQQPDNNKQAADVLPVTRVVLFNSGVGYFQREGEVAGDTNVEMAFATADVNDLLKSLVLEDANGGKVNVVSYDSQDPVEKILRSFALDLTSNPSFGEILNQARGEKVEVQLDAANNAPPATVIGTVIGMEVRAATPKDAAGTVVPTPRELLNLLTEHGMKSIPLNHIKQVRFLNASLANEFQQALQVLAASHDVSKKRVTLGFKGNGKRTVRVGYVVERPIWKMTYRLRVEPNGKIFLQGWALVENTSDNDWKDVRMVLVSGRPISFKMNLYEPLYIPRPTVEPDLFASLRPPVYESSLPAPDGKDPKGPPVQVPPNAQFQPNQGGFNFNPGGFQFNPGGFQMGGFNQGGFNQGGFQIGGGGFQMGGFNQGGGFQGQQFFNGNKYQQNQQNLQQLVDQKGNKLTYEELQKRRQEQQKAKEDAKKVGGKLVGLNFREGIESVAAAEEIGDYFQYRLDSKVTLARQRSAMLPVFNTTIEGAKVSIYNRSVHKRHPLLGLRFKNTSGKPLTQGPITVYEDHGYSGDTRILDLQPNEERLLSYAMDLGTKVFVNYKTSPAPEMTIQLGTNQLTARYKNQKTTTYTIVNRSTQERRLIVEHPVSRDWKLIDPIKPLDKTNEVYRFEVPVPTDKSVNFDVVEEQEQTEQVALHPSSGAMPYYASAPGLTVHVDYRSIPGPEVRFTLGGEKLTADYQSRKTTTLLLENRLPKDRTITFEYPVVKDWTLLSPTKAKEEAKDLRRFEVKVAKDKSARFEMVESQHRIDPLALSTAPNRPPLYAVAAGIEMKPVVKTSPRELVGVEVVKGVLHVRHKTTETKSYYVRNGPDEERTFVLDQLIRPDWTLIDAEGKKHAGPGFHRYRLKVAPDATGVQTVKEENITLQDKRTVKEELTSVLTEYVNSPATSAPVKLALAKSLKLLEARLETERKLQETQKQMNALDKDQTRLRANLQIIPMNSDPYKRFLDKFVSQETQIETLQKRMVELQASLERQTKEYDDYVKTLTAK